jgi:microcompartment protein CcmK/EutM
MRICTVVGTVVATEHHPVLGGKRVLIVDDGDGSVGGVQLAVDAVGAGNGCRVLVFEYPPLRSVIVGILDELEA